MADVDFTFGLLFVARVLARHGRLPALRPSDRPEPRERIMTLAVGLAWFVPALLYLFGYLGVYSDPLISRAAFAPGCTLAIAGLALISRSRTALGASFTPYSTTAPGARLATSGPYRFIRHPLYSGQLTTGAAAFFITGNFAVGLPYVAILAASLFTRVPAEEAQLIARYGESYRRYAARTPRFFPSLRRARSESDD